MVFEIYLLDVSDEKVYFYSNSISYEHLLYSLSKTSDIHINEGKIECGEGVQNRINSISIDNISFQDLQKAFSKNCKDFFVYSLKGSVGGIFDFEIYENNEIHLFINKSKFILYKELIMEILQLEKRNLVESEFILETVLKNNDRFCEFNNNELLRVSKEQLI
jgi:hypothetical protein